MKKNKGFTLAELLIVVAIIAVLVAIAIPIFTAQLHESEVATDIANVRAYYAEIQSDYITTGVKNPNVKDFHEDHDFDPYTLNFLNGNNIKLKAGVYYATLTDDDRGYQIVYSCNKNHSKHEYLFGN